MVLLKAENLQPLNAQAEAITPPLSFSLSGGDLLLIKGENGSGKSSLLKTILGLHRRQQGVLQRQISLQEIAYLPQLGNLQFHIPMTLQDFLPATLQNSKALVAEMDLQKPWNTASGGERQKVLLAALLESGPELLILDEPFNHIDEKSCRVIETALKTYLESSKSKAIVLVSHRALTLTWNQLRTLELP